MIFVKTNSKPSRSKTDYQDNINFTKFSGDFFEKKMSAKCSIRGRHPSRANASERRWAFRRVLLTEQAAPNF
jgi:hypothetical protein